MLLACLGPCELDIVHDDLLNLSGRHAQKFVDAAMTHPEEDSIASVGCAPSDAIRVDKFVLAFVRKAIRGFAGYIGHGDLLGESAVLHLHDLSKTKVHSCRARLGVTEARMRGAYASSAMSVREPGHRVLEERLRMV